MFETTIREGRRARAVDRLRVLGSKREPTFNDYVEKAARAFNAPVSLLSLIKGDKQWFKAAHGMDLELIRRNDGFCTHVLECADVMEICDPAEDARFSGNPIVCGPPGVRYYIGAPLRLIDGMDVGALCVIDMQPRGPATADQRSYLRGLARQAALAFEVRADLAKGAVV
jgi:GAF domain-containing protein